MPIQSVPRPQRISWWTIGLALGGVVAWTVYANLGAFVVAIFLYYATRPIHRRVRQVVPSRTLSVVASLAIFVLPAIFLIGYAANVIIEEAYNFAQVYDLSNLEPLVQPYVSEEIVKTDWYLLVTSPFEFFATNDGILLVRRIGLQFLDSLKFFGAVIVNLALVLILGFYFLRDDDKLSKWLHTHLGTYLPHYGVYASEVDEDLSTIFFGNILHAVITAIIAVIVYTTLSLFAPPTVPFAYPALIGLLCGVFSLVPVVGTKIVYGPYALYMAGWAHSLGDKDAYWFLLVFVGVSYIVVDTIPDVVLRPYVSTKRIHLGVVMVAYILGPLMFGWYGLFLMPVILVMGLHFANYILPHLLEPEPPGKPDLDPTVFDPNGESDDADGSPDDTSESNDG